MESTSLYRKYRPLKLSEVIGQEHITKTLANQIKAGKINHAYLFCGSRGIGKTSIARIFARAINCPNQVNGDPCGKCEICDLLSQENLDIVEIDAASNNRVDEIRELREKVKFSPINTKKKVYIIDEVHMLSDSAFNALLKTLEEPPEHVVFILATTEPQKLPATILSRCVRFDFRLLSHSELETLLMKVFKDSNIKADEGAIKLIADTAQGSARDCLSIAEMCASFCDNNLSYEKVINVLGAIDKNILIDLNQNIIDHNIDNVINIYNNLSTNGKSINILIKEMLEFYKDLIIIKSCKNANQMISLPDNIFNKMNERFKNLDNEFIVNIIDNLAKLEIDVKNTLNPNLLFEAFLIKQTLGEIKHNKVSTTTTKQEVQPTSKVFIKTFGKLLTELKNQGYMAVYGVLSEITNGRIENGFLIAYVEKDFSTALIDKEANKTLINTILSDVLNEGLIFKFEITNKVEKGSFDALNTLLNGKLKIE